MREILLRLIPMLNPCFGSVSPVSNVKSPGLPSTAGMGVQRGDSPETESSGAAGAGTAAGGGNGVEDVVTAASPTGAASAIFAGAAVGVAAVGAPFASSPVTVVVFLSSP